MENQRPGSKHRVVIFSLYFQFDAIVVTRENADPDDVIHKLNKYLIGEENTELLHKKGLITSTLPVAIKLVS